jgi:hypothetical protein
LGICGYGVFSSAQATASPAAHLGLESFPVPAGQPQPSHSPADKSHPAKAKPRLYGQERSCVRQIRDCGKRPATFTFCHSPAPGPPTPCQNKQARARR